MCFSPGPERRVPTSFDKVQTLGPTKLPRVGTVSHHCPEGRERVWTSPFPRLDPYFPSTPVVLSTLDRIGCATEPTIAPP
jgi:hypothetical protein